MCIGWFTLEYLLRLLGAPSKCDFLRNGMNLIDALSVLPYYVELGMAARHHNTVRPGNIPFVTFQMDALWDPGCIVGPG